jgi:hypothetical protein
MMTMRGRRTTLHTTAAGATVTHRWRRAWHILPLLLGLFFLAWALHPLAVIPIGDVIDDMAQRDWAVLIIGICAMYGSAAGYLNRTRITLTHDDTVIGHGPLPVPFHGRHVLPALRTVTTYHDRVVAFNHAGNTYVVSGSTDLREHNTLMMCSDARDADAVADAIRGALRHVESFTPADTGRRPHRRDRG